MKKEPSTATTVETQNGRKLLSLQEAEAMLPDGNHIHTFRNNAVNMMIGADWKRVRILEVMALHGVEPSGPIATSMGHGLWVNDGQGRGLFVATRKAPSVSSGNGKV